jgi:hypothetical protein
VVGANTSDLEPLQVEEGAEPARAAAEQRTELLVRLGREQPLTGFVF